MSALAECGHDFDQTIEPFAWDVVAHVQHVEDASLPRQQLGSLLSRRRRRIIQQDRIDAVGNDANSRGIDEVEADEIVTRSLAATDHGAGAAEPAENASGHQPEAERS